MTKATGVTGDLEPIPNCYIKIYGFLQEITIPMKILPDISDSKSAKYSDQNGIGRSSPFKSYENSEIRSISWTAHFIVLKEQDKKDIVDYLRALEACVYPQMSDLNGTPYAPPPICEIRCGVLLNGNSSGAFEGVKAVLKQYSVKFDTSVPWDQDSLIPNKLDVDLTFEVVHNIGQLPGAESILEGGW